MSKFETSHSYLPNSPSLYHRHFPAPSYLCMKWPLMHVVELQEDIPVFCRHLEDVVDQRTAELISLQRSNAEQEGTDRNKPDGGQVQQVSSYLSHIAMKGEEGPSC